MACPAHARDEVRHLLRALVGSEDGPGACLAQQPQLQRHPVRPTVQLGAQLRVDDQQQIQPHQLTGRVVERPQMNALGKGRGGRSASTAAMMHV